MEGPPLMLDLALYIAGLVTGGAGVAGAFAIVTVRRLTKAPAK